MNRFFMLTLFVGLSNLLSAQEIQAPRGCGHDQAIQLIQVFPNPSKGLINLQASDLNASAQIKIYDTKGNLVKWIRNEDLSINRSFNLSDLPTGLYHLLISSGEKSFIQKVVLQ